MVTMMRRMARLAPRVLFSPVSEVQTRTLTTSIPLLVSPSPVWSGQQSLRRPLQPPAAPGFARLEEKTEMISVLHRPENRQLYEKLNSGTAESPLDTAGWIGCTFSFTIKKIFSVFQPCTVSQRTQRFPNWFWKISKTTFLIR